MKPSLIKKVDCIQLYVPDIQSGIKFYQDKLGHKLKWRTNDSAGFQMQESESEIVIQTSRKTQETDLLVESVDSALVTLVDAGAEVMVPAFNIQVGRCAVVLDPWGNRLVILDLSKGVLLTDSEGKVVDNEKR
jgi:predicted enzyme related to lactoylglutathione lyase